MFKTTTYFEFTRNRPDRALIKNEWIEEALNYYIKIEKQSDGRIRKWCWVESEQKYLRVIVLEDGETVHNAFFDRRFKRGV
jgi:hypothetical protein